MVRRAQRPGEVVGQKGHSLVRQIAAALQRGNGVGEVALFELEDAQVEEGMRSGGLTAPKPAQVRLRRAPHPPQNFWAGGFSWRH
jgi:hypothetical protein